MRKRNITLIIKNSASAIIPVGLCNNNANSSINGTTVYVFDLSSESFTGKTSGTIEVRTTAQSSYQTLSFTLEQSSIQGLVDALNALGIGSFWVEGTDLKTQSSTLVFGDLDILPNDVTFSYSGNLLGAGNNLFQVKVNGVTIVTNPTTPGSIPVSLGDVITIFFANNVGVTVNLTIYKNLVQTANQSVTNGNAGVFPVILSTPGNYLATWNQ